MSFETKEQRQQRERNAWQQQFIDKVEAMEELKVEDHAAAWAKLKADYPDVDPPLTKLSSVFGYDLIKQTSQRFYDHVWEDADWFSRQFKEGHASKEAAVLNQSTFFVEQFGGPPLFSEWRNEGGQALVAFTHQQFTMTAASMKRWLGHMNTAVDETGMREKAPEACAIFLKWCDAFGQRMVQREIILNDKEPEK